MVRIERSRTADIHMQTRTLQSRVPALVAARTFPLRANGIISCSLSSFCLEQLTIQQHGSGSGMNRRRRDSVQPNPSSPPRSMHLLGPLLYPQRLPPLEFDRIQRVLDDQNDAIKGLEEEIEKLTRRNDRLQRELSMARRDADRKVERGKHLAKLQKQLQAEKETVADLRAHKKDYDEQLEGLKQLMTVGTKVLNEKTQQADALSQEVHSLRSTIDERDNTITSLHEHISEMTMAPPDQWAAVAVEAQAHRTLSMVKGLQGDLSDRDANVANQEAVINSLTATNTKFEAQSGEMQKAHNALEESAKASRKKATEAQSVLDDQSKLIERLLKENERLAGVCR
jgi:chromosome segregation ATPase